MKLFANAIQKEMVYSCRWLSGLDLCKKIQELEMRLPETREAQQARVKSSFKFFDTHESMLKRSEKSIDPLLASILFTLCSPSLHEIFFKVRCDLGFWICLHLLLDLFGSILHLLSQCLTVHCHLNLKISQSNDNTRSNN